MQASQRISFIPFRRHGRPAIPIMCVDPDEGIYVTPGLFSPPIHVTKSTSTPIIDCEVSLCRTSPKLPGNPGKACVHLERSIRAPGIGDRPIDNRWTRDSPPLRGVSGARSCTRRLLPVCTYRGKL